MMESRNDGSRDLAQAVATLADRLPQPLTPLAELTFNYRWAWMAGGAELFGQIDPVLWRHSQCNPRELLESVSIRRLRELAGDATFVDRLNALASACKVDAQRPNPWQIPAEHPVAYFCAEFGFHGSMAVYSGGLGVLAGDILKTASDLALPLIGIGLFYRQGYFHQRIDVWGWQHEYWVDALFERLPVARVSGADGQPLSVVVKIRQRHVVVHIWRVDVGRTVLYLLDTDHELNHPVDRWITSRLYVGDRQTRLAQYALLGIGGVRALAAMGIQPSIVHLNEGHAALSSFERLRQKIAHGELYDEALANVQRETVFTTHTPVAAGNEGYYHHEVEPVLGELIDEMGIGRERFYDLGRVQPGNQNEATNITPLSLRTSRAAIGVSRRHGRVARSMWQALWPDRPVDEVPIGHVTNGVHVPTWMAPSMQALLGKHLGPDWRRRLAEPGFFDRIDDIPDAELWAVRCQLRQSLVEMARQKSIRDRLGRGENPGYVEAAASVFEPATLTIGFARRVATYKRLYLLSRLPDAGLLRLLSDNPTPIQLVLAGKAHPSDQEAKEDLRNRFQLKQSPEIPRRVVFLEDYDLQIAPTIVAGVDLWLNLPRPPLEASGTSGMKVTLNGGINLSVMDGWWAEAYDGENGWAIHSPEADAATQDDHDAEALLHLLEREVIPLFYQRDSNGLPHAWLQKVKRSMRTLIPQFSAERMVSEYVSKLYA
ncbi:MAG: alpha-glucan family phosphorylase [Deltaproteobacteria bacterium]|nr:alpha-glucan family phosphorylase [Deltaproteobacteria bacterium]